MGKIGLTVWAWGLLTLLGLAGCESRPVDGVTMARGVTEIHVPFQLANGKMLTDQVKINGRSVGWFVIDSGANSIVLDRSVLGKAGIGAGDRVTIQGGAEDVDGQYTAKSISVGGMEIRDRPVFVGNDPGSSERFRVPVAGLLGGGFLSAAPFTVDFRKSEIIFYKRESFRPPAGAVGVDLHLLNEQRVGDHLTCGNPEFTGKLNGEEVGFLPDTGSPVTLLLKPGLMQRHAAWRTDRGALLRMFVSGGDYVGVRAEGVEMLGRKLGAVSGAVGMVGGWHDSELMTAADVEIFDSDEVAIVGMLILRDFRLTFDYEGGHCWAEWQPRSTASEQLAAGLDPNALDLASETALMRAVNEGRLADVKALLKAGARIDVPGRQGLTALHFVGVNGTVDMLDAFAGSGQKVNWDIDGKKIATPLFLAASVGNVPVLERLLALGADANSTAGGVSAIQSAVSYGQVATYDALLRAGAKLPGRGEKTLLHMAATAGRLPMLKHLLESEGMRKELEWRDDGSKGMTPFLAAVASNRAEAARELLEAGADGNARDAAGESAMDLLKANEAQGENIVKMKEVLEKHVGGTGRG